MSKNKQPEIIVVNGFDIYVNDIETSKNYLDDKNITYYIKSYELTSEDGEQFGD